MSDDAEIKTKEELEARLKQAESFIEKLRKGEIDSIIGDDRSVLLVRIKNQEEELAKYRSRLEEELQLKNSALEEAEEARKLLEEQLQQAQKLEIIGTLASGIAHDFNNILTPIVMSAEMGLMITEGEPKLLMGEIRDSAKRAVQLVNQILAFSRGKRKDVADIEPVPIMREAVRMLRSGIPANISINVDMEEANGTIKLDPVELHQVLMNLCVNAFQAIGEENVGEMRIRLRSADETEAGFSLKDVQQFFVLEIEDNGPGIPQDEQEKIFETFYTTKKETGTGLGLATVRKIVERCGGRVQLFSKPGDGAKFSVYLPKSEGVAQPEDGKDQRVLKGGDERIVFVDDESGLGRLAKTALETLNYSVRSFDDPNAAFRHLQENINSVDILAANWHMPSVKGGQLARRARELNPNLPLILTTGDEDIPAKEELGTTHLVEILYKPFQVSDLTNAIENLRSRKKLERTQEEPA